MRWSLRILLVTATVLLIATGGCTDLGVGDDSFDGAEDEGPSSDRNGNGTNDAETYALTVEIESEDGEEVPAYISIWKNEERVGEERYGDSAAFDGLGNGTYEVHVLTDDEGWSDERIEVTIDGDDEEVVFEPERTENGG